MQNGEKKKSWSKSKKIKETVFIVGDNMTKKIDGYLLTKSISHKFLLQVRPFTIAKTTDIMTI